MPCGRVTATSLELPQNLTFEEWRALGAHLVRRETTVQWWIGDWCAHGERCYRRDYGAALERIYGRASLHNLASIARKVEAVRRREDLSFSHHAVVAPLAPAEQSVWLDNAARNGWAVSEFRRQVAHARRAGVTAASVPRQLQSLAITLDGELAALIVEASSAAGVAPVPWVHRTLAEAAASQLARPRVANAA